MRDEWLGPAELPRPFDCITSRGGGGTCGPRGLKGGAWPKERPDAWRSDQAKLNVISLCWPDGQQRVTMAHG